MSHRYSIDKKVKITDLEKHSIAFAVVTQIMNTQSQPIWVVEADASGLIFDLRVNLPIQTCERLIIKEINDNLPGYIVELDWKHKKMAVVRDANKGRKAKSTRSAEKDAA